MTPENYKKALFGCKTPQGFAVTVQKGCTRCSLWEHGCGPIVYRGNPSSKILLLGESPGKAEEEQRKPFVGPAGKLLDKIFEGTCNLDTNKDLICSNVSYCRPTAPLNSGRQNYTPKNEQLDRCWPFVETFIEIVDPKIIIACGRTALQQLTGDKNIRIGTWEGKWLRYKKQIPMFVITHPASILHLGKWPDKQQEAKEKVRNYMKYFNETWKDKYKEG